ncbi:MAG TPA: hypothetical protein VK867_12865, partial [Candidatus Limnocylindrales bacterium]|nr:hypothetical protein [Candidatus Limnocylindrales bacterium]
MTNGTLAAGCPAAKLLAAMSALADPPLPLDRHAAGDATIGLPGGLSDPGWLVVEDALAPERVRSAEPVFAIGNGRFSTRGSFEERFPGDQPATLMHGVFAPHPVAVSELANLPDWTALEIVVGGERFSMASGRLLAYRRSLDLRSGLLRREVTWRSPGGATVEICFERFASLADPRVAAVRATVTSLDFAGGVEVRASLSARADTDGRAHLESRRQCVANVVAELDVNVRGTATAVGLAMRLRRTDGTAEQEGLDLPGRPTLTARSTTRPGGRATFEKLVVVASSRDSAGPAAATHLTALGDEPFDSLFAAS